MAAMAGADTVYDVVKGPISQLKSPFNPGASVLGCGVVATTISDPAQLAPGAGRYYLVRAANACGKGTWGEDSSGDEHQFVVCP
jgi:hypothetical protein